MPLTGRGGAGNRLNRTPSPEHRRDNRDKSKTPLVRIRKASGPYENQTSSNNAPRHPRNGPSITRKPETGGERGDDDEIAQDPFFQRYNVSGEGSEHYSSPPLSRDSSSDTEGPLPSNQIRHARLPSPARNPGLASDYTKMQEINICVLGASRVGKTTFIMNTLDLRTPPNSAFNNRKMAIDENVYLVRLVELPFDDIPDLASDDGICWPDTIDNLATPRIDGAYVLYDVTNRESLSPIPEMLNALKKAALPFALVAWKCDNYPALRKVEPTEVEQKAKSFLGDIATFRSSQILPDMQRKCFHYMLRSIVSRREDQPTYLTARRRANSSAVRHGLHGQTWAKKHERASSEYSGIRMRMHTPEPSETGSTKLSVSSRQRHQRTQTTDTTHQTFLDLDDSPGYDSADTEPELSDHEQMEAPEVPSGESGYTFDQLVTRLLAQPMSKNDTKYQAVFLALYRKFATPGQLLDVIIERFQMVDKESKPQMLRTITQQRHLAIVEQWIRLYPGDFAFATTRRKFRRFVSRLVSSRMFAVAAREIATGLEAVAVDDDTDWACCDRARDRSEAGKSFTLPNSVLDEDSGDEDYAHLMSSISMSETQSRASVISVTVSTNGSSHAILNGIEIAQKQARTLVPLPRITLTKTQWHTLMGIDEGCIARELTRIDWIMFSAIRPRDLVRHVSLNAEQKKSCRSLENVERMISHFNHIAAWVANYVLLRDKPKHRALMLEKFMKLARKVREMNNYNALGAILAGINGTAVHRLAATRELIPLPVARDFMKLEILMGTQRSHFAYRLAWDNSSGERIPYLPLHRRDLVSAAEGNSTFVGDRKSDATLSLVHPGTAVFTGRGESREAPPTGIVGKERINWKKFEIMGEVIVGVQRAQGTPYPQISRNDEVRSLLLEVKLCKDDEELYDRSVQLEAAASSYQRRFNWFKG